MGFFDLLGKAVSKVIEVTPAILEELGKAYERGEKNRQEMEERVNSYIPKYQHLTMKKLKDEFTQLNGSNEPDVNIKKRAISSIINNRQSQIQDLIREYSKYHSSILKLEYTNVTHGRANYCISYDRFNGNLTDAEIEMRLIAIQRLLNERKE